MVRAYGCWEECAGPRARTLTAERVDAVWGLAATPGPGQQKALARRGDGAEGVPVAARG